MKKVAAKKMDRIKEINCFILSQTGKAKVNKYRKTNNCKPRSENSKQENATTFYCCFFVNTCHKTF